MAVERSLYNVVSKQLPRRVAESTINTATEFVLKRRVGAAAFLEALFDSSIAQASGGTRKGEARVLRMTQFFGRRRW